MVTKLTHIVNFSFGLGSYITAKRVAAKYGVENTILLFADTKYEDEDTYNWGREAAKRIGAKLVEISDGRTIWQLFKDSRCIGNTMMDVCSRVLKRELCDKWLKINFEPFTCVVHFGIHWSEKDRFCRIEKDGEVKGIGPRIEKLGYFAEAILCEPPFIAYEDMKAEAIVDGLWEQKLYKLGFPHANCGGRCVKQGKAGWKLLLDTMPDRYKECEEEEERIRQFLNKNVSILRETVNGVKKPITLKILRERIESENCHYTDFGGCSCFAGDE